MDDVIYRQDAIDEANAWLLDCFKVQKQNRSCGLIRRLEDLPPAQPTQTNTPNALESLDCIDRQDDFEKQIHAMFDHIWDCEIDHPVFHDTVGDLMAAVIQCHKGLTSAEPEISLHESCTDCPLYDKDRHSCPRFNKVIPETLRELQSTQPDYQEVLGWLLAYHTKSFDLHGRYFPNEVIAWLINDFSKEFIAERGQDDRT